MCRKKLAVPRPADESKMEIPGSGFGKVGYIDLVIDSRNKVWWSSFRV